MIKKISYFLLCTFLIFTASFVMADRRDEPYDVIINNISMTRGVAERIFEDAKRSSINIYDKKGNKVDTVTKGMDVVVKSTLMVIINDAYSQIATINQETNDVIATKAQGVVVFVRVKKGEKGGIVNDLIIE